MLPTKQLLTSLLCVSPQEGKDLAAENRKDREANAARKEAEPREKGLQEQQEQTFLL